MLYGCPGIYHIVDIRLIGENLVRMHAQQSGYGHIPPHNYFTCDICPKNNQGCPIVQATLQEEMDLGWIQRSEFRDYHVNKVDGCPGSFQIFDVLLMNVNLVALHSRQSIHHHLPLQDYVACRICSKNNQGCYFVQRALQKQMDLG